MLLLPLPSLAALTAVDGARLDQYEKTVFGSTRTSLAEEARLRALETNLFGKTKSGSAKGRLDAMAKLISPSSASAEKPDYLPPMAAQMDSSAFPQQVAPVTTSSAVSDYTSAPSQVRALQTEPADHVKDLLRQALQKHTQGDSAAAQKLFKQVLSIDHRNVDANFNLAAMAEDSGDLNAAQRYFKAAAEGNPGDSEIQDALASINAKLSQQHQARETATQVAKKNQLRQVAQDAATAYKAGRYDQAISLLEKIDREAPGDANVKYGLGQAYRGKGDMQRANQNLQAAASIDPNNQLYRNSLGELAQQQQQVANQPPPQTQNSSSEPLPSGGRDYGQQPQVASDYAQPGQLTPFSGDERLYGSASGGGMSGMSGMGGGLGSALGLGGLGGGLGALMGNRTMSSSGGRGTRMVRGAVTGSLAGAAAGAVSGRMRGGGGAKSGAMRGAVTGGLFGLLTSF